MILIYTLLLNWGIAAFAQMEDAQVPETFLVKPYVYTIKGQRWALAWSYKNTGGPLSSAVRLAWKGHETVVPATLEGGLFTAILPMPSCDFGTVLYTVPGQNEPHRINDIPCPQDDGTTRFTFMADAQEGPKHDKIFAKHIKEFNGSAVLIGGDLVQTGDTFDDWIKFFDAMDLALQTQILVPVIGNHEYRTTKSVPYWKHYFKTAANEDFYALDIGPVHVMAINSAFWDDPEMRLKQLPWLKNELEKLSRWKVVFFHHPPFSRSISNMTVAPKKEWKVLQEDYVPLFEHFHVDLVLNGHTHLYEHSVKNGVQYLTVGPAGGIMGTLGSQNPFTLESHLKRTIAEIEASKTEMRIVSTDIEGKTLGEIDLKK